MHGNDALPRSGRSGYPQRPIGVPFYGGTLRRVEKNEPFRPRLLKRLSNHLFVAGNPEPSLSVGMREGIGLVVDLHDRTRLGSLAGCDRHQGFLCFFRQSRKQIEEVVFVDLEQQLEIGCG